MAPSEYGTVVPFVKDYGLKNIWEDRKSTQRLAL
jgi:hypothetical protein